MIPQTRAVQAKNWCFTHNNYEIEHIQEAKNTFEAQAEKYIFAQEVGEAGTPHLQGFVRFKAKVRFTFVQKLFPSWGVHWEKCKGSVKANIEYCTKVDDFSLIHGNIPEATRFSPGEQAVLDLFYLDVEWKGWQQRIISLVNSPPNPREIWWYYEPDGNVGKTFLARWLCIQYRCQIGNGKKADVFNGIAKAMEVDPKNWPRLILLDIPRSMREFVNYGAIEEMKNGFIFSGKYEGAQLIFPPPHVIVFSNERPITEKMSTDRWRVVNLRTPFMPVMPARKRARNGVSGDMV